MAAAISVPEALALGTVAFAPLGPKGAAIGAIAGLSTLVVHNIVSAVVKGTRPMTAGAYSLSSLMVSAAVSTSGREGDDALTAIVGLSLLAGFAQTIFGALKLGFLGKYIPYPVIAGLVNGTAILMLTVYGPKLLEHGGTLVVGLAVLTTSLVLRFLRPKWPGPVVGLGVGVLVFHVGRMMDFEMGTPLAAASGDVGFNLAIGVHIDPLGVVQAAYELWPSALGVALVCSLRTLIVMVSIDRERGRSAEASKELLAQGVGNLAAAVLGGVPAAPYNTSSLAAIDLGARTRQVRVFTGMFAALSIFAIAPLVSLLPLVALSAMLVAYAVRTIDPFSLTLAKRALSSRSAWSAARVDLVIVASVTTVLVTLGILEAVVIGVGIALASFLLRMSRPPLRRRYTAARVRATVERPARECAALEAHGAQILVLELQGALFFGAADHVARHVDEGLHAGARTLILDAKRVAELDSTGAQVILQAARACREAGASLTVAGPCERVMPHLDNAGIFAIAARANDIEQALGAAEDALLDEVIGTDRYLEDIDPSEVDALRGISLPGACERIALARGELLFNEGDPGDGVYFLLGGRVELLAQDKRVAVLCPGTVLGEMALLDGRPRAASAKALEQVALLHLSTERFIELKRDDPALAVALLEGLAAELARRLRVSNRHHLELEA